MRGRVIGIERVAPRDGLMEEPELTGKGYRLGDPRYGSKKHHALNSVHVRTLDEAAALVEQGFSLWMVAKGKRASLVSPGALRIRRAA